MEKIFLCILFNLMLSLPFSFFFCSTAWDKKFNPIVNELANGILSHYHERFQVDGQIKGLQRLLYHKDQNGMPLCNYVEKLCGELELFATGISEHLSSLEKEVHCPLHHSSFSA